MPAEADVPAFREPTRVERIFNRAFGFLVGLGLGLPHNYLLQVRGRKTGRIYSTPINLLVVELSWSGAKRYLVAPRGRTQWVRNVEAAGEIALKKGRTRQNFRVRPIPDSEKPEFLKLYLERFTPTVQRYFPIPAGSPVEAFHDFARNYPVFELLPS
jgi:deazaflavin-dependent oxidoreductase (nitroreductase family)